MATKSKKLRSNLKNVRGLGSAHSGSGHWIMQRATAILNIILMFFILCSLTKHLPFDYDSALLWAKSPLTAITLIILIPNVLYHAGLGLQVVFEDYIHGEFTKLAAIYVTKILLLGVAVLLVFAVLYINFKL